MFQTGFGEEEVEHNSQKHQCDLHNAHSRPRQTPATPVTTTRASFTSGRQSRPGVVRRSRIYRIHRSWSAIPRIHTDESTLCYSQSQLSSLQSGKKDSRKTLTKCESSRSVYNCTRPLSSLYHVTLLTFSTGLEEN